jgi:hypothetical protein
MPKWILRCVKCKTEFEYSQINDVGFASLFLQPKPDFSPAGNARASAQIVGTAHFIYGPT